MSGSASATESYRRGGGGSRLWLSFGVMAMALLLLWALSSPNATTGAVTLTPAERRTGAGTGRVCSPQSTVLYSRVSFPKLALDLQRYLTAATVAEAPPRRVFRAVEIGSLMCANVFSFRTVLEAYAPPGTVVEFYSVDAWGYRGKEEGEPDQNSELIGRQAMKHCHVLLNRTFPDTQLRQGLSADVARTFPDAFFDLVYIDALHTYDACKTDMNAWWPKLKPGGLFSGDDYGDFTMGHLSKWEQQLWQYRWGVVRAVREFSLLHNIPYTTTSHEHKMHPAISNRFPKLSSKFYRGLNPEFLDPVRGHPNWYMFKPHPAFDLSCTAMINTESWLSKFEIPFASRKFKHMQLVEEERLVTGWTRIAVQRASGEGARRVGYLMYLPEAVTDPIDTELGPAEVTCSLMVFLHGAGEVGDDLSILLRKRGAIGDTAADPRGANC